MCDRSHLVAERRTRELRTLRDALFDELDALRTGTGNPKKADQVAKRATKALKDIRRRTEAM